MNNKEFEIKKNDMRRKSTRQTEFAKDISPLSKAGHYIYMAEHEGGLLTKDLVELGEEIAMKDINKKTGIKK